MEKDKLKKKIRLKANDFNINKLLLKKEYILKTDTNSNILILSNEVIQNTNDSLLKNKISSKINLLNFKNKNINKNILSLRAITKSFEGRPILKNISFNLKKGQILGLMGPNGSGKTTLFKILAGEVSLDSGDVYLNGENIKSDPIHIRSRKGISYLQTHKGLFENLTAYENLYGVLELYMNDKNKIEQKIFKLLSYFGLQYLSNIKSRFFSAGEMKKVAALQRVCNRKILVLLMDEPISALDPISINSIKNFILEIRNLGISIIITEHNVKSISDILDYVILIRDGEIMAEGTMKEIGNNQKAIKYYLGSDFKL